METLKDLGGIISAIISFITLIGLYLKNKDEVNDFFETLKHKVFSIIGILSIAAAVPAAVALLAYYGCLLPINIEYSNLLACILLSISVIAVVAIISIKISRKRFRDTLNSTDYHEWLIEVLQKIYPGWKPLTINKTNSRGYPGELIKIEKDFNFIKTNLDEIEEEFYYHKGNNKFINKRKFLNRYRLFDFSRGFKAFIYRVCYYILVRDNIRYPDLIGYTLETYETNKGGVIENINCSISTYYQNVMESHIMEYELYRLYNVEKDVNNIDKDMILKYLPYRMAIHKKICGNIEPLISEKNTHAIFRSGAGRPSLLSVQALIAYKTRNGKYRTYIGKRNNNVAIYQGRTQIAPAGGFEMYEREKDGYNWEEIKADCKPEIALYREILEEIFNKKEFDGENSDKGIVSTNNIIENTPPIKAINETKNKILGGISIDLVYLRHTLSYLVKADKDIFAFNDEAWKIFLSQIEFEKAKKEHEIPGCLENIFNSNNNDIAMTDTAALAKCFLEW